MRDTLCGHWQVMDGMWACGDVDSERSPRRLRLQLAPCLRATRPERAAVRCSDAGPGSSRTPRPAGEDAGVLAKTQEGREEVRVAGRPLPNRARSDARPTSSPSGTMRTGRLEFPTNCPCEGDGTRRCVSCGTSSTP
ncbi:hypothetical protein OBBRIDRAFT_551823 [Obba rivulosa]|uniref:Uncharacterized protein n=1 Tax=Obba rivulosa TaxID=1052685 RepID=A0A8E2DL13_9APHY|nr:hypothetical protein OBBRIDRAFT_551823 [Obba rivulosa]